MREDDLEEIVSKKKKGPRTRVFNKLKKTLIILLIGMIIGIVFGHFLIEPLIQESSNNNLRDCLKINEILNAENYCLYEAHENPQEIIDNCTRIQKNNNS